jgi:hypothetical protein
VESERLSTPWVLDIRTFPNDGRTDKIAAKSSKHEMRLNDRIFFLLGCAKEMQ